MSVIEIIAKYREAFLDGLLTTLRMSMFVWSSGIVFGVVVGALAARSKKSLGNLFVALSFFLGAIPVLVLLYWVYYPLQMILNVNLPPIFSAIFVISVVNIFAVANIVRTGLLDFPQQYEVAARVCGLKPRETLLRIKLPLIARQIIPSLLPIQIVMLQTTLFASLISVEEIFRVAQRVNSVVYKPVEIYSALGIFFLLICLPVNLFAYYLKQKYTRDPSES